MNPALVRRQVALAGVALLAALATFALSRAETGQGLGPRSEPAAPAEGEWLEALAGSYGPGRFGQPTACGVELTPTTRGIAHPVLPCGAKIVVLYRGRAVRTEVVDRGPYAAGHDFDVTQALAAELGLDGIQRVRWRFAES